MEIKGVQELGLIDRMVELEVLRQVRLLEIRDELVRRSASADFPVIDVTDHLRSSSSRVVLGAIKKGGSVLAARLQGFAGLVGREVQPGRRLGTEMSDRAKRAGVGGLFHTVSFHTASVTGSKTLQLFGWERNFVILVARRSGGKAMHAALGGDGGNFRPRETRRALPEGTRSTCDRTGSSPILSRRRTFASRRTPAMLAGLKLPS